MPRFVEAFAVFVGHQRDEAGHRAQGRLQVVGSRPDERIELLTGQQERARPLFDASLEGGVEATDLELGALAFERMTDGSPELRSVEPTLRQRVLGADGDRLDARGRIVVSGQDDDGGRRGSGSHPPHRAQPGGVRQPGIQQDDVEGGVLHRGERGRERADDLRARAGAMDCAVAVRFVEDGLEQAGVGGVVLDDEDAERRSREAHVRPP